jgi:8-oxo-dGTP pyrophosphatase MutT (NUDIX family)
MSHIHKLIDYVVSVYIVFKDKVLFIHHKKLNKWLPIGGHIELDEDPEEALFREVKEECGLKISILGEKPKIKSKGTKILYSPIFLNIHKISDTHKHIGLCYFAKAKTDKIILNKKEHNRISWFNKKDLNDPKLKLDKVVKFYAKEALKKLS